MDKPRICEVLGVEVGEAFAFNDFPFDEPKEFLVNEYGEVRPSGDGTITPSEICYIINHTDCIIRKPRWTEQDIEDAKALMRVFDCENLEAQRDDRDDDGVLYLIRRKIFYHINDAIFPSLKPGETVSLDEIIGGNE